MIKAINKKTIKKINDKLFRVSKTNFLSGTNSRYVEQMMEAWKKILTLYMFHGKVILKMLSLA